MGKILHFNDDARRRLQSGVDQLADAVKVTLGPEGPQRGPRASHGGSRTVANDEVAHAREIELSDPFENMGAMLVREVATKTSDLTGDGTTTATLLAQGIVREGMRTIDEGANPMLLRHGIEVATQRVVEHLRSQARPVSSRDDLAPRRDDRRQGGRDDRRGAGIAEALDHVGQEGVVTVEESAAARHLRRVRRRAAGRERHGLALHGDGPDAHGDEVYEDPYIFMTTKPISAIPDLILGVRMRRTKEVGEVVLKSRAPWQEVTPERQNAKDPAALKVKEVTVEGRRYVVCLNEEERRKDAHDRATILEALREQLRRGDKSLIGNKGYRRFLKIEGGGHFTIDDKQVAQEESYDGLFVLRTDTEHDTETVARVYKMLWMVEDTFRTAKSILETRPIYHKSDEAIRGHIFCSFLALVLKRELEIRMQDKGLSWQWAEILRGLDNLQEVEAEFQGHRFVMRGHVIGNAMQAIRAVGAALPPNHPRNELKSAI